MLGESLVTIAVQRLADLGIITVGRRRRFRLAGGRRQEDDRRDGMPWWRVAVEREAGEPAERQSYDQHPPRNPRGS
jgi:hypothetical protein